MARQRAFSRRLRVERLEDRRLMAADLSHSTEFDRDYILVELENSVGSVLELSASSERIGNTSWWTVPVQGDVASTVAAYATLPGVLSATPDYVVDLTSHQETTLEPNDRMLQDACMWGLDNHTGGVGDFCGFSKGVSGADINAIGAWSTMAAINTKVVVAVIDTGVDYTHPDLVNNIWLNTAESLGKSGVDDDNNGYIDDIRGWDFVGRDKEPMDLNGHGTHVAGTIGASGNNDGVSRGLVGVAYNNVSIMPLRVFDAFGRGKSSSVIAAIDYAVANGAKISNNSYSIGGLESVVARATATPGGHLFVAAAGNSNTSTPAVPASYQPAVDSVVSVAASTHLDTYASFSNFGSTVDLAAPGNLIWSTYPINLDSGDGTREGYRRMSGTSMATPHVAGAAALVWANSPGLTALDVKARLLSSGDPMAPGSKSTVTNRRLDAANAIASQAMAAGGATTVNSSSRSSSSGQISSDAQVQAITSVYTEDDLIAPPIVASSATLHFVFEQSATATPRDLVSELRNTAAAGSYRHALTSVDTQSPFAGAIKNATSERRVRAEGRASLRDSVFSDFEHWPSLNDDC